MEDQWCALFREVLLRAAPEPVELQEEPYVQNLDTAVVHRIVVGDVKLASSLWRAGCGCRFGTGESRRCSALPDDPKLICERCLSKERGLAKHKFWAKAQEIADKGNLGAEGP